MFFESSITRLADRTVFRNLEISISSVHFVSLYPKQTLR